MNDEANVVEPQMDMSVNLDEVYLSLEAIRQVFPLPPGLEAEHSFSLTKDGKLIIKIFRMTGANKVLTFTGKEGQFFTNEQLCQMRDAWIIEDVNSRMHKSNSNTQVATTAYVTGAPVGVPGRFSEDLLPELLPARYRSEVQGMIDMRHNRESYTKIMPLHYKIFVQNMIHEQISELKGTLSKMLRLV